MFNRTEKDDWNEIKRLKLKYDKDYAKSLQEARRQTDAGLWKGISARVKR